MFYELGKTEKFKHRVKNGTRASRIVNLQQKNFFNNTLGCFMMIGRPCGYFVIICWSFSTFIFN